MTAQRLGEVVVIGVKLRPDGVFIGRHQPTAREHIPFYLTIRAIQLRDLLAAQIAHDIFT
jgi:hypothetical protein